jgi:hypothetical protein
MRSPRTGSWSSRSTFGDNIAKLRSWGVTVLYGPEMYPLHEPGTGEGFVHAFPWILALEALG